MTLPRERFAAISKTRHFLDAITDPKRIPGVPKQVRDEARRCLRHYPYPIDIAEAIEGLALAARIVAAVSQMQKHTRRPPPVD